MKPRCVTSLQASSPLCAILTRRSAEFRCAAGRQLSACAIETNGTVPVVTTAHKWAVSQAQAAVAPEEGFEPPTQRLTAACSTTELLRNETGGADRIRTGVHGFAGRCVATPPPRLGATSAAHPPSGSPGPTNGRD